MGGAGGEYGWLRSLRFLLFKLGGARVSMAGSFSLFPPVQTGWVWGRLQGGAFVSAFFFDGILKTDRCRSAVGG